jgi:filamentous hemagglutinin
VLNDLSDEIRNRRPTGNADIDQALGQIVATGVGTAVGAAAGGASGAFTGFNTDRFNRQLHPDEKKWIKDQEAAYAKQYGLTLEQAKAELTMQANLQVQNGSPGTWNQRASNFLARAHGMLPADGNSGPGYMFHATPEQKANVEMYAKHYPNGVGMNTPAGQAITASMSREQAYRDAYTRLTIAAAAGAGTIAVGGPIAALPGTPIFSSGGALGSGAWASRVGVGTISAGINASSQYLRDGTINPIDVVIAGILGGAGVSRGLGWNVLANSIGGAVGTTINNKVYGKDDSIIFNAVASGAGSAFGYRIGKGMETGINFITRPTINSSGWADIGKWAGPSGWNLLRPNNLPTIGSSIGGGFASEFGNSQIKDIQNHMDSEK